MTGLKVRISDLALAVFSMAGFFRHSFLSETCNDLADEVVVRKGTLIEMRRLDYPQFAGSAIRSVRMPFPPAYLFKVDCNDYRGRETICVLADKTTQNEDALPGMSVTVTSRKNKSDYGTSSSSVKLD